MKKHLTILASLIFAPMSYASVSDYQQAKQLLASAPEEIKQVWSNGPQVYQFSSRFDQRESVQYDGQTLQQVLIAEVKNYLSSLDKGSYQGTTDDLLSTLESYYSFSGSDEATSAGAVNGSTLIKLGASDTLGLTTLPLKETKHQDIVAVSNDLKNSVSGEALPLRRGQIYGWLGNNILTPNDYIHFLFEKIAYEAAEGSAFNFNGKRISKATITADGYDVAELVQKFFYGAVSFSQAAEYFLGQGLLGDNTTRVANANYTELEHNWDQAFGQYGATRDYLLYTDKEITSKGSKDTNGDNFISLKSEMNFGMAIYAASVANAAKDGTANYNREIVTHFIQGRALISARPQDYEKYIRAHATILLVNWEKVFAAKAIGYMNKLQVEIAKKGTAQFDFANIAKYWSEMKGLLLAIQYSPVALMDDATFDQIHASVGSSKPDINNLLINNNYSKALLEVRETLKNLYQFSDANVANW